MSGSGLGNRAQGYGFTLAHLIEDDSCWDSPGFTLRARG